MTKIYIVTAGDWDAYRIYSVWDTKEKAEAELARLLAHEDCWFQNDDHSVEEWEMNKEGSI